jgi:probable HAF family extracellular repeat protein
MKKQVVVTLCLAWLAVCFLARTSEAVRFKYENLGNLGATLAYTGFTHEAGINDAGQVVGIAFTASGARHAFFKSPGHAMVDLGNIPDSTESHASCINNNGLIGGYYHSNSTGDHSCQWSKFYNVYEFEDLGGPHNFFYGINADGFVVGSAVIDGGQRGVVRLLGGFFSYQNLGALPGALGSEARGINNSGTIVGYSYDSSYIDTACFWLPSLGGEYAIAPLISEAGSRAYAINNPGQVVGQVWSVSSSYAFLKSPDQPVQNLGVLPFQTYSIAYAINDSGWIVGESGGRAFLWTSISGMQDLNNLVAGLPAGVTLREAYGINKRGEIAGYTDNSVFRLVPIAEPPLSLLLLE